MFYVVNKVQLERAIGILREDRKRKRQGLKGPWLRMEASDRGQLILATRLEDASMPATVYEPGVLFLKVTAFRRLLHSIEGQQQVTIQVNERGLLMDNIEMPFKANCFMLYENPASAPRICPLDKGAEAKKPGKMTGPVTVIQETLFEGVPKKVFRALRPPRRDGREYKSPNDGQHGG